MKFSSSFFGYKSLLRSRASLREHPVFAALVSIEKDDYLFIIYSIKCLKHVLYVIGLKKFV